MKSKNYKNRKIKVLLSNQNGMALLTTLIFVFILVTFAVTLLTMTSNDIKLSALQRDSTKAFYLTEAGIQRSIKELKNDFSWKKGFNSENLGEGTYTVVVEGPGEDLSIPSGQVRVTSTGKVANSVRNIEIFIKSGGIPPIFEYAIVSKTNLKLTGSSQVTGNIYSGDNIELTGSTYINGDVNAVGKVKVTGSATYTGNKNEGVAEEIFPIVDTAPYISEAQAGGTYKGDYKITGSGTETLGPLYINGDLKVTGSADVTLEGTVYVTGKVEFTGSGSVDGLGTIICVNDMKITGSRNLTPANMPVFISTTGNITVTGSADMQLVVYAPEGNIKVTGSSSIYGALIAGKEYDGTGSSKVIHPNLDDIDLNLPPGPFSIVSWQEIY